MTSRLDRWLAPRLAARAGDTLREIAADPTVVSVKRNGAALPGTITVRVVASNRQATERQGAASQSTAGDVTILAAAGTTLLRGDLLQAPGSVIYRVTFVPPGQEWRVEAAAEVVG
jgi:hypothetical protein